MLTISYLISQILAALAMIVNISSQQYKARKKMLLAFIAGNLLNSIHFLLLGAMTGFVLALIGVVRFTVSIYSTDKRWLIVFLLINSAAVPFVFEGYLLSGVSYIAATFIIISTFLESDHWMRVVIILGSLGWLIYGILIGSLVAIISNGFFLGSSIVGWYRHIHLRKTGRSSPLKHLELKETSKPQSSIG
ncbi:MAG: YgjV family protein [Candidatus Gracilibacteria bacterium]|nr:YgjV family protein [Candidatus Gracilibacteria bacterium]